MLHSLADMRSKTMVYARILAEGMGLISNLLQANDMILNVFFIFRVAEARSCNSVEASRDVVMPGRATDYFALWAVVRSEAPC